MITEKKTLLQLLGIATLVAVAVAIVVWIFQRNN